jgi:hypothetical protein
MKYRLLLSSVLMTVAVAAYAVEEPKDTEDKPAQEQLEQKDTVATVQNEEKAVADDEKSDNTMWYIIGGVVVAIVGYAIFRRSSGSKVVVTFDELIGYAEAAKNSGASYLTAFKLSSMPEEQQKTLLDQMGLSATFKRKGYMTDSTLVVAQLDENDNVLSQRVYYGHAFDEKLSAAFSSQTMLKITLK